MIKHKILLPIALCVGLMLAGCGKVNMPLTPPSQRASASLREGGYLYRELDDNHLNNLDSEMPTSVELKKDEGGDTSILQTKDENEIAAIVKLFKEVRISGTTDTFSTDQYNAITFKWSDGSSSVISLNGMNLELKENGEWTYYTLKGLSDLWETAFDGSLIEETESAYVEDTESETEETEVEQPPTKETDPPTQAEPTETEPVAVDFEIVPSEASTISYQNFSNDAFSAKIPEGWRVDIFPGDYLHYTFKIYDPEEPRRMVFFNMKTEGYPMTQEDWQFYQNTYPNSVFGQLPYIDPQTTENFYNHFTEALRQNDNDTFTFPIINQFQKIETYGTNATTGEIVRASYIDGNGDVVDGIFSASLYPIDLYYTRVLNVYDTWYVSAPEGELPEWLGVLSEVFSSIEFTDQFLDGCYDQLDIEARNNANIAKICAQMSDIVMEGWQNQQESYDRISQKQSDATLGYERVYDNDTGEIYKAPLDFYDHYSGDRYVPVTDDQYLLPVDGYIEY